jgi:cell division transport system permease protein
VKFAQIGFVGRRVRNSLWELLWSHMLTAGTMAMTLFVFGGFLLLQENLQNMLRGWGNQIQINGYLDKSLDADTVRGLLDRVRGFPEVESVRHISQERAWTDFQAALGSQSAVLDGLPHDVLPASLEITLKADFRDGSIVEAVANRLRQEKGIILVEYPQEWVDRLNLVLLGVEWAKWIFGGGLFMATFFIVGSTVKLAILARRDEIEIMQLVGASEAMIQAPFVLEGMIQGVIGALVSLAGLWLMFQFLRSEIPAFGLFGPFNQLQFLNEWQIALMLAIGWVLGAAGSLFSLRRFIKTWSG